MAEDTPDQAYMRAAGESRLQQERAINPDGSSAMNEPYHPKFCDTARKLVALAGATELELADYIGCRRRDITRWRIEHPEFDEAIRIGDSIACDRVKKAMYERAIGYTFDEEKVLIVKGVVERHVVRKHLPPDVTACQAFLHNRQPDKWSKAPVWAPEAPAPQPEERIDENELVTFLGDLLVRAKARATAADRATYGGTKH